MSTLIKAAKIYKEYQITAATASATTALSIQTVSGSKPQRVIVEAKTADVVFKFGKSDVAASKTVASSALADGNFSVTAGSIMEIDLPTGTEHSYVSVQGLTADGTAIVRMCAA